MKKAIKKSPHTDQSKRTKKIIKICLYYITNKGVLKMTNIEREFKNTVDELAYAEYLLAGDENNKELIKNKKDILKKMERLSSAINRAEMIASEYVMDGDF